METKLLTFSQVSQYRACERRYKFEYRDCIARISAPDAPKNFGSLFHSILEAYYRGGINDARAFFDLIPHDSLEAEFLLAKARAIFESYVTFWKTDLQPIPGMVEKEGAVPIINPATLRISRNFQLGFKIDMLVSWGGRVYLLDHKTTSMEIFGDSDYWHKLVNSTQVPIYISAAQGLGFPVEGFLFNAIRIPRIKPLLKTPPDKVKLKKDGTPYADVRMEDETPDAYAARIIVAIQENPSAYFARREVVIPQAELKSRMGDIWSYSVKIRQSEIGDSWPRNESQCHNFNGYGKCDFFGVCWGTESLDDETLFRKKLTQNEELKQEENPL